MGEYDIIYFVYYICVNHIYIYIYMLQTYAHKLYKIITRINDKSTSLWRLHHKGIYVEVSLRVAIYRSNM